MPIAHKINVEVGCMSRHLIAKIITHQQCVWLVAEKEWQLYKKKKKWIWNFMQKFVFKYR